MIIALFSLIIAGTLHAQDSTVEYPPRAEFPFITQIDSEPKSVGVVQ